MDQQVAFTQLTVKAVDEEKRVIRGIATTPEPDRVGDIVEPMGVQFKNPLPLLWMHQHNLPVGTVNFGKPTKDGVPFEASFPVIAEPSQLRARIEEAFSSVKAGLVRHVSIGFRPVEYSVIEETGGLRFTRSDVFELSLVTVPANASATIQQIKALDQKARAALGLAPLSSVKATPPGASGTIVKLKPKQTEEVKNMKISEQIKSFSSELSNKREAFVKMAEKSGEEGATFDAAEQEQYDTLAAEIEQLEKHISRLQLAEKAALATATPISSDAGLTEKAATAARQSIASVKAQPEPEKGIQFARYAMCKVAAKNNPQLALQLAKTHYQNNSQIIRALEFESMGRKIETEMKAAVNGGTTLDSTWAGALVDYSKFTGDFIEYLRPQTIIGQFGQGNIPSLRRIPFNVNIKGQSTGGSASWVGEGKAKPVTKFDFFDVELRWSKLAAIAVLTEEVIRFSNPSAEALVRDALAGAIIERMDADFVDPTKAAVANVSPASITYGVTAVVASGTDADAVNADVKALWEKFLAARNPPSRAVFIMDSVTAASLSMMQTPLGQSQYPGLTPQGGTFMGRPAIVSDYVPRDTDGGTIILSNASDIYLADDGQVIVDMSNEAAIQMADNPTGDSTNGTGTTMVSMWQTNSVAFRAERYINWAKRRSSAVQYISGVNYGG